MVVLYITWYSTICIVLVTAAAMVTISWVNPLSQLLKPCFYHISLLPGDFWRNRQKEYAQKAVFFNHRPVPLYCTYVLCTQGRHNILLIEDIVQLRAQKHKPTMASAASPRAANPKMVESPYSMVHASSSYAWAEDGYFKHPHTVSIDGDIQWDSCWFFVGFGVGGCLTCN